MLAQAYVSPRIKGNRSQAANKPRWTRPKGFAQLLEAHQPPAVQVLVDHGVMVDGPSHPPTDPYPAKGHPQGGHVATFFWVQVCVSAESTTTSNKVSLKGNHCKLTIAKQGIYVENLTCLV